MGIVLTITTVAPIVAIVRDTFVIHPGTIDEHLTGMSSGYSAINYVDLFTSTLESQRFVAYAASLPDGRSVTSLIGITSGGYAIVTSGTEVYSITLPQ